MAFNADHFNCAVWWKWSGQQHAHIQGLASAAAVRVHCFVVPALNFPEPEKEADELTTAETADKATSSN